MGEASYREMRLRSGYHTVAGEHYGTPKEVWGFRAPATGENAVRITRRFLQANADMFELQPGLEGLSVRRVVHSLGATHVILQQVHGRRRIHRGYVTAHVDPAGHIYMVKNRSVPRRLLPGTFDQRLDRDDAVQHARRCLPQRGRRALPVATELLWYPRNDSLVPAWKLRLMREGPREDWIVYVSARSGALLHRYDNLAQARPGKARVFDPSPVTALDGHDALLTPNGRQRRPPAEAYLGVRLRGLDGAGRLTGDRCTTRPTRQRLHRPDLDFMLRSHERGFEEVMTYFHIDSAIRYLEKLGFKGRRAIFREPVKVNARGTREDNSWYSPFNGMLTFGTGAINDAEDAETIIHELGHAIQDAIVPDFGQSEEAAAMGEGFGDYFAASYFEPRKPARYRESVMTWDGLLMGLAGNADPPCLRRVDEAFTFDDFEEGGDEHDNGVIWSATLWDVRQAMGREKADRIIVESHFQLDGFTTFARGARAIIDADEHLEDGRNRQALERIFRRRRINL